MERFLTKGTDSINIRRNQSGNLVEIESGNKFVASISNEEIILQNYYEVKVVPVSINKS